MLFGVDDVKPVFEGAEFFWYGFISFAAHDDHTSLDGFVLEKLGIL